MSLITILILSYSNHIFIQIKFISIYFEYLANMFMNLTSMNNSVTELVQSFQALSTEAARDINAEILSARLQELSV